MRLFNIVGSPAADALQQTLNMAQNRHRILADNVANIDTPGYRMRDLNVKAFEERLAVALTESRKPKPSSRKMNIDEWDSKDPSGLSDVVFHDDNDRSVEKLMVELSKNANKHAQAASVLRNQLSLLRAVISEQV